jgi:hypothetical protein
MDWLTGGGPKSPSSPSSGARGSTDEKVGAIERQNEREREGSRQVIESALDYIVHLQDAMIELLKANYEEVAYKLAEETREKERILGELQALQKRSSMDVLENAPEAKAEKEGENDDTSKEKDAEIEALKEAVSSCADVAQY